MAIAVLLCLPVTNKYIFLQYVFVLMTSHIQILYLVAVKPYQSPLINMFVLANETFYSTLVIMVFIFSDATPQIPIKVVAGYILMVSIFLLLLANLAFIVYCMWKGRAQLKEDIKKAKKKRADQEAKEEEDERKRKEEEEKDEFDKIDENKDLDEKKGATAGMAGSGSLDDGSDLGKKQNKKIKANQDDVEEMNNTPDEAPKKKKKKKKKMKAAPPPADTKQGSSHDGSATNGPGGEKLRGSKTSGGNEDDSNEGRVLR